MNDFIGALFISTMWTQPLWTFAVKLWALRSITTSGRWSHTEWCFVATECVFCTLWFVVYDGYILCLYRSCLHLCGAEFFIRWEENHPASLTGTWNQNANCLWRWLAKEATAWIADFDVETTALPNLCYILCPGSTSAVPRAFEGLGCTALGHRVKVRSVEL